MPDDMESVLGNFFSDEVEAAPRRYNGEESRFGVCPPLSTYLRLKDPARWKPELRQHIRNCPYCQRSIAMAWRFECPPDEVLLDPSLSAAARIHREQDACARCQRVKERPQGRETQWVAGRLALMGAHSDKGSIPWYFQCRSGSVPFVVTLWEDHGKLIGRVQCSLAEWEGRTVRLFVRLQGEVLSCELKLKAANKSVLAQCSLGDFDALAVRMKDFSVATEIVENEI